MNSKYSPSSKDRADPKNEATVHGSDRTGLASSSAKATEDKSEAALHNADRSGLTSEARSANGKRSVTGELVGLMSSRVRFFLLSRFTATFQDTQT